MHSLFIALNIYKKIESQNLSAELIVTKMSGVADLCEQSLRPLLSLADFRLLCLPYSPELHYQL